jgi:phosphatidylserine/phosphatidylglycerophosphate/cardiolipin synthase-like enzyme
MTRADRASLARELDAIRAAGGIVTIYRPAHAVQRWVGGGQHVKIHVSEKGEAIFGSSNITKSSFEGWNEYSVALRGPVIVPLLESYRQIGGQVADEHLSVLADVAGREAADIAMTYWFCNPNLLQGPRGPLGWRGANPVTDRLIDMVDAARHSVRLTSFYFKPVSRFVDAIVRAVARGVHVEVFHSHRDALPATDLAWIAAAAGYDRLLAAGVALYENVHGEHSKILLVDDEWVAFGSYNFEDPAHDRLAEAMLASRDVRAVVPAHAIFEELRRDRDNRRVTAESFAGEPARVKARIARFGRFKRWM